MTRTGARTRARRWCAVRRDAKAQRTATVQRRRVLTAARCALLVGCLALADSDARAQTPNAADQQNPAGPVNDSPRLTWAVNERVRFAGLFNQFRPGLSGDDQSLVFRTTARAELAWPSVSIVGEIQDARAYLTGQRSNVSTSLINPVDLLQAYVMFAPGSPSTRVPELQIGRFTMELGSGRLIAQETYRDVTRNFSGAKLRWPTARRGVVTAFAVLPVMTVPDNRDDLLRNRLSADREYLNQKFWGALYEKPLGVLRVRGEGYFYALHEHDEPGERETRDRNLWTSGFRLLRPAANGDWDADIESAWQGGRARASTAPADRRSLDVAARLLHLHAGYSLARPWSPRLGVEYDYGSGEADPADGEWNRFDALFGHRRTELGPTSIYGALGRENINTLGARVSLTPTARTDVFAAYRVVRLAAAADAFASTGVRDATGRSGRDGGRQLDVRVRAWIKPDVLRLELGATHLMAGRFLRTAPNATREGDTTFVYCDLTYSLASKPSIARDARR